MMPRLTDCRVYMRKQLGVTMIEVLITIVIVVIGLLGLAGLQLHIQSSEQESYQRGQAIVLLQDMVDRLTANRKESTNYVTNATGIGAPGTSGCGGTAVWQKDLCDWSTALAGAAETRNDGQALGAMLGARGCIFQTTATMPREYVISVVWQGLTNTMTPAATNCGQGEYGNEAARRAITARVIVGCLENNPTTGACVTP
jgi:type IV pilus assembly protein PilV